MKPLSSKGNAFKHAAPKHRSDREIVLAAVKQTGDAFKYAAPKHRSEMD